MSERAVWIGVRLALACALGAAAGCDAERHHLLIVDVRSDLRPGVDFAFVRVTVEGRVDELAAGARDDFLRGVRAAEVPLEKGRHFVSASLLAADRSVVVGEVRRVDLEGAVTLTFVLTADCVGVTCPGAGDVAEATSCQAGRCVVPDVCGGRPAGCGLDAGPSDAGPPPPRPVDAAPPPGDAGTPDCTATHPLLMGMLRYCSPGDCFCPDPDACFETRSAAACCTVAVTCY